MLVGKHLTLRICCPVPLGYALAILLVPILPSPLKSATLFSHLWEYVLGSKLIHTPLGISPV